MAVSNQHLAKLKKQLKNQAYLKSLILGLFLFTPLILVASIICVGLIGNLVKPANKPESARALASQDLDWLQKNGTVFANLTNDLTSLSKAGTNPELAAACTQILKDSVQGEYKTPPIPDTSLNNSLSSALKELINGSQKCQSGVSNENANDITQATTDYQDGKTGLDTTFNSIIHGKV